MDCDECHRLERLVLESFVFADKAETALKCYSSRTSGRPACQMEMNIALYERKQKKTTDERHKAYMDFVRSRMPGPSRGGLASLGCDREHGHAVRRAGESRQFDCVAGTARGPIGLAPIRLVGGPLFR
jgi:hypothetical protein